MSARLVKRILFFAMAYSFVSGIYAQLIINEVSQGYTGNQEYVELIVVGTPTCTTIPCLDLRGYYIDDNNGNYATGGGTGIAQGCVRLSNAALWSCIPVGTLIVIYNDADINPDLPADDLSMTDGNCRLVIPISNCTLFEKHTTQPSTSTATYPTTGLSTCGNWNNISMANSDDSFQTLNASGTPVFSVSWGNNTSNNIIYFAPTQSGKVALMGNFTNNNPTLQSNWTSVAVAGNQTPGSANNAANATWINSMNNSCAPVLPLTLNATKSNAGCACTGSATSIPSGAIGPYSYSWSSSTGTGATENALCAGTYTVTVTSNNGCTQTSTVAIAGTSTLTFSVNTKSVSCFAASDGVAAISPTSGTGPYTYSWFPAGGTASSASALMAGIYTCTITDGTGCSSSTSISITEPNKLTATIGTVPPTCGNNNGEVNVIPGGGTGTYTYDWLPGGATGQTVIGLSANAYTVTVTDNNSCTQSAIATLSNSPGPILTYTQTPVTCYGGNDGGVSLTISGGASPFTITWSTSQTGVTSLSGLNAGSYSVSVVDKNNCTSSEAITVTEPTALNITTNAQPSSCGSAQGSASVTIVSGGVPGYAYSWSDVNGSTGPTANNLGSGTYTVTVKDKNSCTETGTVVITNTSSMSAQVQSFSSAKCAGSCDGSATVQVTGGAAPYVYSWSGLTSTTSQTNSTLCQGTYTVVVKDINNCASTTNVTITEPTALTLGTTTVATICIGQSATLIASPSGGTAPYTLAWAPTGPTVNPIVTSTYTVTLTDANTCVLTPQTVVVPVNPPLAVSIATPGIFCEGDNIVLTGSATGGDNLYTYSWQPGGATTSTIAVPSIANTQQTYSLTVADGCGTPASTSTVSVFVNPLPVVAFTSDKTEGCAPLCVNFSDASTGTIVSWSWDFGGVKDATGNPQFCFGAPGSYSIKLLVTSDKGCTANVTATNYITVYSVPIAKFTSYPSPATIIDPTIHFTDASVGATSWLWDFGDPADAKMSVLQNPSHTYKDTGTYCTQLKVSNVFGCADSIEDCIQIGADFTFFIPDAFSPNGDNRNEVFIGRGIGVKEFNMLIFDRWGSKIFETNDVNQGWDGKANKGKQVAQQDIYVYQIYITDTYDHYHSFQGHVSLIH